MRARRSPGAEPAARSPRWQPRGREVRGPPHQGAFDGGTPCVVRSASPHPAHTPAPQNRWRNAAAARVPCEASVSGCWRVTAFAQGATHAAAHRPRENQRVAPPQKEQAQPAAAAGARGAGRVSQGGAGAGALVVRSTCTAGAPARVGTRASGATPVQLGAIPRRRRRKRGCARSLLLQLHPLDSRGAQLKRTDITPPPGQVVVCE